MDLSTIVVGTAILRHKCSEFLKLLVSQIQTGQIGGCLWFYGDYTGWTIFEDTFVLSLAPTSTPACSTRLGRWSLQYPCLSGIILGTGRALNHFQTLNQKWFQKWFIHSTEVFGSKGGSLWSAHHPFISILCRTWPLPKAHTHQRARLFFGAFLSTRSLQVASNMALSPRSDRFW